MKILPGNRVSSERGCLTRSASSARPTSEPASFFRCRRSAAAGDSRSPIAKQRGVLLIECIVYFAVLVVLLNIALLAFNRCWDDNKRLRRNAEDIVRALHAGEQWRADVRAATGTIRVVDQGDAETVVIPSRSGKIIYSCAQGEVRRQAGAKARAMVVVDRVKSSQMHTDARHQLTAWRWELELLPARKDVHVAPLFTFETVAVHSAVP